MTSSWRWSIQPETAINRKWNGSRILWVFKAHYREHRATAGNNLRFRQIQYSDHTGCWEAVADPVTPASAVHCLNWRCREARGGAFPARWAGLDRGN